MKDWEKFRCINCNFFSAHNRSYPTGVCTYKFGCSMPHKFQDKNGVIYELDKSN